MTTRITRTREEEDKVHERFEALFSQIKPLPADIDCINILKRTKLARDYHRLMIKNIGNKHEKAYRSKRYNEESRHISSLEYYLKSKSESQ